MFYCKNQHFDLTKIEESSVEKTSRLTQPAQYDEKIIIDTIKQYSHLSKPLEPSNEEVKNLSSSIFNYANRFLAEINDADVFFFDEETTNHSFLEALKPTENASNVDHIINITENHLNKSGLNTLSPNHFGYIPAGGIYASALADYLVSVANRFPSIHFCAPAIVELENAMIRWFCTLFGYSEKSGGVFTSGGSMATLTAIIAARDKYELTKKDLKKTVVYLTPYSHHCIQKGLNIAGLNQVLIRMVRVDESFKMDTQHLNNLIEQDVKEGLMPWMVVGTAGTTDLGSVDPIDEIERIGHQFNMWVHVDAAYGGFFILTEKGKHLFKNFHLVDSIVVDPHKSLFLPYGIGSVLVKDMSLLLESFSYDANYLRDYESNPNHVSPADLSLELSRNFRGLKLWLPIKLYGIKPFRAALEEKLLLAQYFYTEIQKIEGVQIACKPELSIVTFRYIPKIAKYANTFNSTLIKEIQSDGKVFMSSTLIEEDVYLRMACLSFRSHLENVQLLIDTIREKISSLNQTHY